MPLYTIIAKRETLYEFNFVADNEDEAMSEVERIEITDEVEDYAYDWTSLKIDEITESETI